MSDSVGEILLVAVVLSVVVLALVGLALLPFLLFIGGVLGFEGAVILAICWTSVGISAGRSV